MKLLDLIKEQQDESQVLSKVKGQLNGLFDPVGIAKDAKEIDSQSEVNESSLDASTIVLLVLSAPHILQGISTITEKINRAFTSKFSKEEIQQIKMHNQQVARTKKGHKEYTSSVAGKMDHFAHWAHDKFVKPIELALWVMSYFDKFKVLRDKTFRAKAAEVIYIAIMIFVAGSGIVQHFGHATSAVDAAKLTDITLDLAVMGTNIPQGGVEPNKFQKLVNKILHAVHL